MVGTNINLIYRLSYDGKILSEETVFSGSQALETGIYQSADELVVYYNFTNSAGLRKEDIIIAASSEMSILDRLKNEYKKIKNQNCEEYTAAVLSMFEYMKFNGIKLSGQEIINILKASSPEIDKIMKDLIKSLEKVDYFENINGCIYIRTHNKKNVSFYKMYFSDKASVKFTEITPGKSQIECLSGVKVGNAMIRLPLNSITVDLPKGDFLFDYGKDNSKQNVNLRKDILEI